MLNKYKRYIKIFIGVIVIAIFFTGGFIIGKKSVQGPVFYERIYFNKELGKPENFDFSLFWDTLKKIEEFYVNSDKIDYQNMLYGAISGMVDSLGDDYTIFMKPEKSKSFLESVSGKENFEGVGMEISVKDKVLTVITPLEGTPAYKAGIKAGDKIIKIDDKTTEGLLSEEAVKLIRGEKGTQVRLLIVRPTFSEPKEFTITRDTIEVPVIRWEMKNDNIAYIRIYNFTANLPSKFDEIVPEILKNNAKKIIIDVRNNPGGYLDSAVEIASWFLSKGDIVLKEQFKNGDEDNYKSNGYNAFQNLPVVVLVNGGSASASEILAGALRDIRNIKLIGEKTFGKGSVQRLESLKDDSSLKITIAKWFTPNGTSIADEGLKPDIETELTEEDFNNNKDPQLEKAIEELNK